MKKSNKKTWLTPFIEREFSKIPAKEREEYFRSVEAKIKAAHSRVITFPTYVIDDFEIDLKIRSKTAAGLEAIRVAPCTAIFDLASRRIISLELSR